MAPKIEMTTFLPSNVMRSDDTSHDLAEQGRAAPGGQVDRLNTNTRNNKRWLKAVGLGAGALALVTGTAGVTYGLSKPHGKTIGSEGTTNLAKAPTQATPRLSPPAALAPPSIFPVAGCIAPSMPQDPVFPVTADSSYPGDTHARTLFTNGVPQIGDIAAVAENKFNLAGGYYPLLESLVAMQPAYVAANVRSDGPDANGTYLYSSRLFNRPDAYGTPTQGWMQSGLADVGSTTVAAWPRVYDHATLRAQIAGIDADHPQSPGDLEDNLSQYRDYAAALTGSPVQALALNAQRAAGTSNNVTSFADKDDNLPFAVEMMRVNPLLFGSLTFDFNQARTASNVTLPSNTTLQYGGFPEIKVIPNGYPAWGIESKISGWSTYAITGMNQDGINVRLVDDPVDAQKFLAYDAMAHAGDILTLGRVYCGASPLALA